MPGSQTFRASAICEGNAGTAFVFDWSFADPASSPLHLDMGIAAGDWQTAVQADLAACLPSQIVIKKWRFACVSGPSVGEIGYVVVTPPQAGSRTAADVLPNEIAISLKRDTGHASRSDRGRIFFGPVDIAYQDTTNPDKVLDDGTLLTLANSSFGTFTTQLTTLTKCLLHADGTWNGHALIHASVGEIFVHRKTRRFRSGI